MPWALAAEGLAQRHPQVDLLHLDASGAAPAGRAARRRGPRPCTTATSWRVSALFSSRSVGSSATRRPSAWESLSSSALTWPSIATGSSGSGIRHGSMTQRVVLLRQGVAGLGVAQLGHRDHVAGHALAAPAAASCPGRGQRADAFVDVVLVLGHVPGDVDGHVGPQGAGEHPDQADAAHVGVARGLDHLGHQRAVGVAPADLHRLAVYGRDLRQPVFRRAREALRDHFEQLRPCPRPARSPGPGGRWPARPPSPGRR